MTAFSHSIDVTSYRTPLPIRIWAEFHPYGQRSDSTPPCDRRCTTEDACVAGASLVNLAIVTWPRGPCRRKRRQRCLGKLTPIEFETINQGVYAA